MLTALTITVVVVILLLILCVKLYQDTQKLKIKNKSLIRTYNSYCTDNDKFCVLLMNFLERIQQDHMAFTVKDSLPFHLKTLWQEDIPLQSIRFKKTKEGEVLVYINGAMAPLKLNNYHLSIDNPILTNERLISSISYLKTQFCYVKPKLDENLKSI